MKTTQQITKFLAFATLVFFLNSCTSSISFGGITGEGQWTKENRNIAEDFNKIDVSDGLEVLITHSDNKKVIVNTDANLQTIILTRVENGTLIIEASESFDSTQNTTVEVFLPKLSGIKSSAGSEVKTMNILLSQDLVAEASSGSSLTLNLEVENLIAKSSSGSTIELNGKAINVDLSSSSGSSIESEKLVANNVKAQSSSGSSIEANPIQWLVATATSGSSIEYLASPKKIEKVTNSGGSVGKK